MAHVARQNESQQWLAGQASKILKKNAAEEYLKQLAIHAQAREDARDWLVREGERRIQEEIDDEF
jgi:hypothetical protein